MGVPLSVIQLCCSTPHAKLLLLVHNCGAETVLSHQHHCCRAFGELFLQYHGCRVVGVLSIQHHYDSLARSTSRLGGGTVV